MLRGCESWPSPHAAQSPADIEASGTVEATSVQVSSRSRGKSCAWPPPKGNRWRGASSLPRSTTPPWTSSSGRPAAEWTSPGPQLDLLTSGAREEDLSQAQEALNQASRVPPKRPDGLRANHAPVRGGAATPKERDDAETRLTSAKAQAAAADQALKKLQNFARPEDLKAGLARVSQAEYVGPHAARRASRTARSPRPMDGIVTEKLAEEGELAAPGHGAVRRHRPVHREAHHLRPRDRTLGSIRLGQQARISIDSFPGQGLPGHGDLDFPGRRSSPRATSRQRTSG